jgi:hypothetical protein
MYKIRFRWGQEAVVASSTDAAGLYINCEDVVAYFIIDTWYGET